MMPADRLTGVTGYFSDMGQLPELLA